MMGKEWQRQGEGGSVEERLKILCRGWKCWGEGGNAKERVAMPRTEWHFWTLHCCPQGHRSPPPPAFLWLLLSTPPSPPPPSLLLQPGSVWLPLREMQRVQQRAVVTHRRPATSLLPIPAFPVNLNFPGKRKVKFAKNFRA